MKRITRADIEGMRCAGCDRSVLAEAEAWLLVCERADELIAKISAAFVGVTLGNGIGLRESDGFDGYMGTEALRQLREIDEKLDWQQMPDCPKISRGADRNPATNTSTVWAYADVALAPSTGWCVDGSPISKLAQPLWTLELVACMATDGSDRLRWMAAGKLNR